MSHIRRTEKDVFANRLAVKVEFTKPSRTLQQHAESCDINTIVARYHRTGSLPTGRHQKVYGDVTALQGDLTERLNFSENVIAKTREHLEAVQKSKASPAAPVSPASAPAPASPASPAS